MKHSQAIISILLGPFFLANGEATIASTHNLVLGKLLLQFRIEGIERDARILQFSRFSLGLSPNVCSKIVLYDEQMQPIEYAQLILSSRSEPYRYVKVHPDSTIKFVCEVDTAYFRYAKQSNMGSRKVLYKDIRFYKLFYRGPADRPRKAIGDLESPLFSLQ